MSEVKVQGQQHKNWLLRALPEPEWIPNQWDTVIHTESGRKALVMTQPKSPKEIFELPEGMDTRPTVCQILLGRELIDEIDVTKLSAR